MARRMAGEFSGTPLKLAYIAGNMVDAERVERMLSEHGIDYALSLEPFVSTSLMRTGEHAGLFVYVPAMQHGVCLEVLEQNGLTDTVAFDEALSMENTDGA
jgi:uncharacterized membrane protein